MGFGCPIPSAMVSTGGSLRLTNLHSIIMGISLLWPNLKGPLKIGHVISIVRFSIIGDCYEPSS